MKFVKLHDDGGREIAVNLSTVTDLFPSNGATYIFFGDAEYSIKVKETIDEIILETLK